MLFIMLNLRDGPFFQLLLAISFTRENFSQMLPTDLAILSLIFFKIILIVLLS